MLSFLRWLRATIVGALNTIARLTFVVIILALLIGLISMLEGDRLPGSMVLTMDLRQSMEDSAAGSALAFSRPVTVLDAVLALNAAERDQRIKGAFFRIGTGSVSVAEAEELGAAVKRFRDAGKFVFVHSQGFNSPGLGDYLAAASADEIWMQPLSPFSTAGTGGGEIFLRGLFDKMEAEPQIVKRAEYKSAADTFMEKSMTPADREQLTALMQTIYNAAVDGIAADRNLDRQTVIASLEASPQLTEDALRAKLIDKVGFDDDAREAALEKAGPGAKAVKISEYINSVLENGSIGSGPQIAVITASGDIQDGSASGGLGASSVIAGDDMASAIRDVAKNDQVKAIILRVDSPGGSVAASDQILDALRKAQDEGKPVIVSMASVAASGGYYISAYADRIVAQPGTITGSIGVLTGKVSIGKSLGLIGVGAEEVSVGKNTLMDSAFSPYTPDQLAAVNREADSIYADFTRKVSEGRKLPLEKVQDIARGRVWSGSDAQRQGLVDTLGGFWDAAGEAKKAAGLDPDAMVSFRLYPRPKGVLATIDSLFGETSEVARAASALALLLQSDAGRALTEAARDLPRARVEMRLTGLPDNL